LQLDVTTIIFITSRPSNYNQNKTNVRCVIVLSVLATFIEMS
jgi:hypothetical protein